MASHDYFSVTTSVVVFALSIATLVFLLLIWKHTRLLCLPWIIAWLVFAWFLRFFVSAAYGMPSFKLPPAGALSHHLDYLAITRVTSQMVISDSCGSLLLVAAKVVALAMLAASISILFPPESRSNFLTKLTPLNEYQSAMGCLLLLCVFLRFGNDIWALSLRHALVALSHS